MNQYQSTHQPPQRSGGGCGRVALIGGGCVLVVLLGFVGIIVAGGILWDRGADAGGNFLSNWVEDRFGTDIGERVDAEDEISTDLPAPRQFHDRDEYLEFLEAYTREFAGTMENVAELLSNPRLRDDDWADDMAAQIAVIRHIEAESREAEPPEEFADAHEQWTNGMSEYRRAIDSTAGAMDTVSPTQLVEAIEALNSATRSYISMAQMLDEIGALEELEQLEELQEIEQDDI